MSWTYDGGTIAAGASVRWAFWWDEPIHTYQGIQVTRARPRPMDSGVVLESELDVSDPGVKMEVLGPGYTYFVTVTNVGPNTAAYDVVGQGVG